MSDLITYLAFYITETKIYAAISCDNIDIDETIDVNSQNTHLKMLIPFINRLLSSFNYPKLSWIGCARGPQAFTTIRIGLSVAQGLSAAFPSASIFSPTHFCFLEKLFLKGKSGIVVIPAGRNNFFYTKSFGVKDDLERVLSGEEISNLYSGNKIVSDHGCCFFSPPKINYARELIKLGKNSGSDCDLIPFYLHTPSYVKKDVKK